MPTMVGAFALDLYKNRNLLDTSDVTVIAVGFVAAFFSAHFVVRGLLSFVAGAATTPFAIWRIAVGTIGLAGLYLFN